MANERAGMVVKTFRVSPERRGRLRHFLVSLAFGLVVGSCNTTPMMPVSKVTSAPTPEINTPTADQASFVLSKVVASIRRGTAIANFPAGGLDVDGSLCNYKHSGNSTLEWDAGSSVLGNWST